MLVLSRKKNESIVIGGVTVTVVSVKGSTVRLGIEAPREVPISRLEPISQKPNILSGIDLHNPQS